MQIANAWLRVHKDGTVPLRDITPAEAVVLNAGHQENANGIAVSQIEVKGAENRTNAAEIKRLRAKYGMLRNKKNESIVDSVYPGVNPQLPQTFKDAGILVPSGAPLDSQEEDEKPASPPPTPKMVEPAKK